MQGRRGRHTQTGKEKSMFGQKEDREEEQRGFGAEKIEIEYREMRSVFPSTGSLAEVVMVP